MTPNLDQERVERAAEAAIAEAVSIDKEVTQSLDEESRRRVTQIIRAAITAYLGDTHTSGWQDIATAPKDGTKILAWWNGAPVITYWAERVGFKGWQAPAMMTIAAHDRSAWHPIYWQAITPPTPPAHPGKEG